MMKIRTRILLLCFFTLVLAFSLWRICGIFRGYQEGNDHYHELEHHVTVSEIAVSKNQDNIEETLPTSSESVTLPDDPADLSDWP